MPAPAQPWSYAPAHPGVGLPQLTLPVNMNLWLLDGTPPSDGRDVSVVIRAFPMLPRAVAR